MAFGRWGIVLLLVLGSTASFAFERTIPNGTSVLCVEVDSGLVVFEESAGVVRPPASMVKMMLMLMVSEGVAEGRWDFDQLITASRKAQRMGGSQVFLVRGETHPLGHMMNAIAVASANDAAMAVAEGLWGSEDAYLAAMNVRADELGMVDSEFRSVHGLPPSRGELPDETTARDIALLGRACLEHEVIRGWVRQKEFVFRERDGTLYNTNKLMFRMDECDGLKTGFIRAAGFCVTATAARDGIRLLVVVMGHPNARGRFELAEAVFERGFASVEKKRVVVGGASFGDLIPVRNSEVESVVAAAAEDLWVTGIVDDVARIEIDFETDEDATAPIDKGDHLGEVRALLDGRVISSVALVAPVAIAEGGWEWRIGNRIRSRIQGFGLDR